MIYTTIFEYIHDNFRKTNETQNCLNSIKHIVMNVYESPTDAINISSLVDKLTKLTDTFDAFDVNAQKVRKQKTRKIYKQKSRRKRVKSKR